MLFAESDLQYYYTMTHFDWPNRNALGDKQYDLIYVPRGDENDNGWRDFSKNWTLAEKCLPDLFDKLGIRILVITIKTLEPEFKSKMFEVIEPTTHEEFFDNYLYRSKMLFIPNVIDASPRVITQALSMGLSILVNENIIGGWQYVNEKTGAFFSDESNVVEKYLEIVEGTNQGRVRPREWFEEYAEIMP